MSDYDRPTCDGDGFGAPQRCCNDRGCPCDVEPSECPGCDACDPPCAECGCPTSDHELHPATRAAHGELAALLEGRCEGCGPGCTGFEATR